MDMLNKVTVVAALIICIVALVVWIIETGKSSKYDDKGDAV